MLKQRIITALIIGPLFILSLLFLPTDIFGFILLAMMAVAAREWADLAGLGKLAGWGYTLIIVAISALMWLWGQPHSGGVLLVFMLLATLWWWTITHGLYVIQSQHLESHDAPVAKGWWGVFTLVPAFVAMVTLHDASPYWLLFTMMIVWLADTFAYFTGKKFGRNKLAPILSPGKTLEGVAGGVFAVWLYLLAVGLWLDLSAGKMLLLVGWGLITTLLSVAGDLFESLLKRQAGVKDSGRILPGHGGMLDRIDSVLAAAPVMLLGLMVAQLV